MARLPSATTIKQVLDNFERNRLAYQVELFLKNGGVIQQLPGYQYKSNNLNPCGWGVKSHDL